MAGIVAAWLSIAACVSSLTSLMEALVLGAFLIVFERSWFAVIGFSVVQLASFLGVRQLESFLGVRQLGSFLGILVDGASLWDCSCLFEATFLDRPCIGFGLLWGCQVDLCYVPVPLLIVPMSVGLFV